MNYVILGLYVAVLLTVGIIGMRKTKTLNDFLVAGRNIGPWVSAFSYGTAYFSAVIFIGYAGKLGWGFGLSVLWIVIGNALIGSFLAWKVLAKRTRRMTVQMNVMTMASFLEKRYLSKGLKLVGAMVIFIFLVPYSASVCMGLSYFFESVFGIPYVYALLFITVLTGVYLTMGGYFSATLVDFIQGIIMVAGVFLMVYFVTESPEVGGFSNVVSGLKEIDPALVAPVGPGGIVTLVSLVILTSLGTWGLPQMVQKYYAVKDERVVKTATWVSTAFSLIIAFGAYFTGSLSHFFFTDLESLGGKVDMIMPTIIAQTLPSFLAVVILIMVMSASMSTLSSLVMVSSSAIAVDLMETVKPGFDKKKSMILMRVLCMVFVFLTFYIALKPPTFIVNLMALSWGVVAGCFLSVYLYGLYSKKVTRTGAWAGLLTGLTIGVGGAILFPSYIPTAACVAMIMPLAVVPIVSRFTKPLPEEHIAFVFGEEAGK